MRKNKLSQRILMCLFLPGRTHLFALCALTMIVKLISPASIHAATITVNDSAPCTLISAIYSANVDSDRAACVASGAYGDDTILIPAVYKNQELTVVYNYVKGAIGLPSIVGNITIQPSDSSNPSDWPTISRAVSASTRFRIFHVAPGGILTLNNLTVQGGQVDDNVAGISEEDLGGAIYNEGTLIINQGSVFMNKALAGGGILNSGDLRISESWIGSNSGGGIYNRNKLLITDSLFSFNRNGSDSTAGQGAGGGLLNTSSGSAYISRSAFYENTAAAGGGGGVWNNGELTLKDSTIGGNVSYTFGGGMGAAGSTSAYTNLINVTITDNIALEVNGGGGIYHKSGILNLVNTLVTGNDTLDASGREIVKLSAAVTGDNQHNLFGDIGRLNHQAFVGIDPLATGAGNITATFDGTNPTHPRAILSGVVGHEHNARRGSILRYPLVANSPAIDAGVKTFGLWPSLKSGCFTPPFAGLNGFYREDQIGTQRPQNNVCDIGAIEHPEDTVFFVIPIEGGKAVIFGL